MKNNDLSIDIPVYMTKQVEDKRRDGVFGPITLPQMIVMVKDKLQSYEKGTLRIETIGRVKYTVIDEIKVIEKNIGDIPCLQLQISAYETNIMDGYFKGEGEKIELQKENRLGSERNFILLVPRIIGLESKSYHCYFLMAVYEDPNKADGEVAAIGKQILKDLLQLPVKI